MPKVVTKVSNKKLDEVIKSEPKSPPVFRLFECVVHLEIALAELKKVGIFPGPEASSVEFKASTDQLILQTQSLYNQYLIIWGAMPKNEC